MIGNEVWKVLWPALLSYIPAFYHEKTTFQAVAGPRSMQVTQSRVEATELGAKCS